MSLKYNNKACNLFVEELEEAGIPVEHYRGRWYWTGPAARAANQDEADEIIRATTVKLQRDQLGLGWIFYPVAKGELIEE